VSTDISGLTELWDPETGEFPGTAGTLKYEFLTDTALMELAKAKTFALATAVKDSLLALYCRDRRVRVIDLVSGRLTRVIDESLATYADQPRGSMLYLEKFDYERRMAVERDIERQWDATYAAKQETGVTALPSLGFDESGTFIYFGSPLGIKVVSLRTGATERLVGKVESTERFLQVALYQGKP
jgi:peptidylprolyl isomerase domain and WD repeat-containing protein 1